jgi:hypothetical protein
MPGPDHVNTDAAFGFIPWGPVISANIYAVVTNNAVAMYRGSLVEASGAALLTPKMGYLQAAVGEETGADGSIIGAVLAVFDHNFNSVKYLAASTTGNSTIAGYVLVADSPHQLYLAQEDGDTASLAAADIGNNVEAIGTTGDTDTGLSLQEIDSDSKNTTSTLALKLVGIHPDDTVYPAAAAGGHARFIVKLNSAYLGGGAANTGI